MINYFNFKQFKDKFLLTNDFGYYMFINKGDLAKLINNKVDYKSEVGYHMQKLFFAYDGTRQEFLSQAADYMRESKNYLFSSTSLHIFVITTACNMQCVYCQAQNGTDIPNGIMNIETAERAVDIALQSPVPHLSFEFQGGEPLTNFPVIKHIIEYTNIHKKNKIIKFNLVSNLTLLSNEILDFFIANNVSISTSLDGNKILHNMNRPYKDGKGTYDDLIGRIEFIKKKGLRIGAIQTTTKNSLKYPKEIIDTYIELGFSQIFIRPLTPLGCASSHWEKIGYSVEEFIEFYKICLEYILKLNKNGIEISEGHASIFLSKILNGVGCNYMELRSPCGAGVGQMAYYYDGNVYTCDEGRMLAEMGDSSFKLGNVNTHSYQQLIEATACKTVCAASVLESIPDCCNCVYQPYCGTCPVINLALDKNIFPRQVKNYRCKQYSGMLNIIFEILYRDIDEEINILNNWTR